MEAKADLGALVCMKVYKGHSSNPGPPFTVSDLMDKEAKKHNTKEPSEGNCNKGGTAMGTPGVAGSCLGCSGATLPWAARGSTAGRPWRLCFLCRTLVTLTHSV